MKSSAVAFTAYPCRDVATTRAWYEQKLGLRFAGPYVEDGVEKYNEAHFADSCFSLMWAKWTAREPGSASSVYFEVADLDRAVAELRSQGVAISDEFDGPVCKQAAVNDPDGNRVSLHQTKTR